MSSIKVTNINNASAASGGIAFDADGHVTVDGLQLPSAGALSNRNKIINGDMRIDQRNAGAAITLTNQGYGLDRWTTWFSQTGKYTAQQNQGSVTPPAGFVNYHGITSSSAYTVTSTDYFHIGQKIEGYNIAELNWGTANAKTVTISFWVRSSLTGNFGLLLRNASGSYVYGTTYAISSANTWEEKTITIAGPTVGAWDSTNGAGIYVIFGLGHGSSQTVSANDSWLNEGKLGALGATSVVGTNGATFYITGVQLEAGSTATPFEHRSYGDELQRCERYFQQWKGDGAASTQNVIAGCGCINPGYSAVLLAPSPKMRGPFDIAFNNLIVSDSASYDSNVTSFALTNASGDGAYIAVSYGSNGTRGDAQSLRVKSSTAGFLQLEAEL